MFKTSTCRTLAVVGFLTLGTVPAVFAQTAAAPSPSPDPMQELLTEIRGLRAEIRRASDASIRAQLLVARLQLQEQRINSLSRQLVDAQRQLSDNARGREAMAGPMAMFTKDQGTQSDEEKEGLEMVVGPLKAQLKLLEKADVDLQAQQNYLTGLIAEEQARWAAFNAMLDDLGKTVEVKPGRQ